MHPGPVNKFGPLGIGNPPLNVAAQPAQVRWPALHAAQHPSLSPLAKIFWSQPMSGGPACEGTSAVMYKGHLNKHSCGSIFLHQMICSIWRLICI